MKRQRLQGLAVLSAVAATVTGVFVTLPADAAPRSTATSQAVNQAANQAARQAPKPAAKASTVFPALTVKALPSGKDVDFATLAKETKPVLVWFWAPT